MLPRDFRKNLPLYIIAGYIFFIGLSYIFSVIIGLKNHEVARTVGSPTQSVLLGIGLMYLSSRLLKRLFRAWLITFSIIIIALARELILIPRSLDLTNFTLLLIAGICLFLLRGQFKAQTEAVRLRSGFVIAIILLMTAIIYGTLGFRLLPDHETGKKYTLRESFTATITEFSLTRSNDMAQLHTRRTDTFLLSLRALGVASFILAGYSLLQPLIYKREHQPEEWNQVRRLLEQYGGNSEDYFKLWPDDKDFIFSHNKEAAIAYTVRNGVALSAGDPVGKQTDFDDAIERFQVFCKKHGFAATFVHVTNKHQKLYRKHQLTFQKIGEEAVVNLEKFTSDTIHNKKWRHVVNKFQKLNYSFEFRQPPFSDTFIDELRRVSDDWLETPGRTERGFVMGYFDEAYLQNCTIGILRNEEKQIVSFINLIESFDLNEANMDLFRQRQGSPTNMNDYMVSQTLLAMKEQGFTSFNLGLCPFVGMDDEDENGPLSRALSLVYNFGGKLYSFKGLHQFKVKFEPVWRDRFVAYEPGAVSALKTIQALNSAMKVKLPK